MYSKSITRSSRALFVVAIDQSTSMAGELEVAGRRVRKADLVAEVVNDLIAELVECSRRADGLRDYYDVAIVGYSGEGVTSLLDVEPWIPIKELNDRCIDECDVVRQSCLESGELHLFNYRMRRWILPKATGSTPMYEALLRVCDIVSEWVSREECGDSFPPIIFNITDGESTDCDYLDIVEISNKIKSLSTSDGEALLFNIHIASELSCRSLLFPSLSQIAQWGDVPCAALSLYTASSYMPPIFNEAVGEIKRCRVEGEQLKAMSFNASVAEVVTILNIGSISVKRG
ncbi:MAG: vWA domain-containing protein [Rikenellaceae bacterium]